MMYPLESKPPARWGTALHWQTAFPNLIACYSTVLLNTTKESAGTLLLAITLKLVLYYTRINDNSCAAAALGQVAEDEPCATSNATKKKRNYVLHLTVMKWFI